jgi:hypothetical protein
MRRFIYRKASRRDYGWLGKSSFGGTPGCFPTS